ncbi:MULTISPECIES: class I SAM-dependent methyltransferase [unclassified Agrococcus]|uniref:class I SAM-dependent methyltransferase n=1 Tax=unclassified Agrococcus TaxID=2615065 RepID=UPI00360B95C1
MSAEPVAEPAWIPARQRPAVADPATQPADVAAVVPHPASAPTMVLVPGRHHLLTTFQVEALRRILAGEEHDEAGVPIVPAPDAVVVWAVTSANRASTRRNPFPGHRREAAIEILAHVEGIASVVVPVVDVPPTDRFAELTLKAVEHATASRLVPTPETAIVACSTEAVAAMYRALGYRIAPLEARTDVAPPWAHLDALMASQPGDDAWRDGVHPASLDIVDRYGLDALARMVAADPVVGDEGGLTATRDYRSYMRSFEDAAQRKWAQARPFVVPGRIVDVGCATGGMLELAAREPALAESDLIGIEVAAPLYDECVHKLSQGAFANPSTYFYRRNIMAGALFPDRSIATTLTFALTHEIVSYGDGIPSLERFAAAIAAQTEPGGVWINSDVCGPADLDAPVLLRFADGDVRTPAVRLTGSNAEVAAVLDALPVGSRVAQFAQDFRAASGSDWPYDVVDERTIALRQGDAMELMTKVHYTGNWLSEMHERFCALSWTDWVALVEAAGLEVDERSGPWRNEWMVEHRFAPDATLLARSGDSIPWPDTHVLLVARRPAESM